jgi:hypothetical protein
MRKGAFERYCTKHPGEVPNAAGAAPGGALPAEVFINATNLQVALHLRNLYAHLLENHYLEGLVGYNPALSDIFSRDVLGKIQQGDSGWEKMVPPKVAEMIRQRRLFGWQPPAVPNLPEVPAWY